MKKLAFLRFIVVGVVSCWGLATLSACDKGGGETPPEMPSVSIVVGESSEHSVAFTISSENADRAAWIILEKGEAAPTSAAVLDGTAVDVTIAVPVVKDGLAPATDYVVYACAANGSLVGEVVSEKVATKTGTKPEPLEFISLVEAGKNRYTYHIESDGTYRHMALPKQVLDNFTDIYEGNEAAAVELLFGMYGANGTGASDYTVASPTEKAMLDVVAGLDYLVLAYETDASGAAVAAYEKFALQTQEPAVAAGGVDISIERLAALGADFSYAVTGDIALLWEFIMYADDYGTMLETGGEKAIKSHLTTAGTRLDSFDNVSEWMNLEPETDYVLLVLGIDSAGDHTELYQMPFRTALQSDVPTENIVFDRYVEAYYAGETDSGAYEYLFSLADREMAEDPEYGDWYPVDEGAGIMLMCDLYTELSGDGRIPQGQYKLSSGSEAGTWNPSDTFAVLFSEDGDMRYLDFAAGTIDVGYSEGGYVLKVDLKGLEGERFTGTFEGNIDFGISSDAVGRTLPGQFFSGRR